MTAYSIEIDTARRLVTLVMHGYWDQKTFDTFAVEYEQVLRRMHASGGLQLGLVDGRDFAVQAKDISEQFGALIARNMPYLARKTASVVPARLHKLQAERAGGELAARYFIDMDEAKAWLFEPETRPA